MQTIDLVKKIVEALEDKKAEDITVLDIGEVSSIADYLIIANGNNANQLTAMEDAVDEAMYTNGVHQKQVEGTLHGFSWTIRILSCICSLKKTDSSMISTEYGEMEKWWMYIHCSIYSMIKEL